MILDEILAKRKIDYIEIEKELSLEDIKKLVKPSNKHKFYDLCKTKDFIYICECKKASPSKGIISEDYNYLDISKKYEKANADVISCLTEPNYFLGNNNHFKNIRNNVKTLMLRKDFIFNEYQIYESKLLGADVILLIVAILDFDSLKNYIKIAEEIGLSVLVECHNEDEIDLAIKANAKVIGVNNRNLKDFSVDFNNALKLRKKYPNLYIISESGVKNKEDILKLKQAKLNGCLVGEALMRSDDPYKTLIDFMKEPTKIKICGLKRDEDIEYANILKPDFIGFVFAKSKRRITLKKAMKLKSQLNQDILTIGVFQNQPIDFIVEACNSGIIDIIQLHGDEDDNYIKELKERVENEIISVYRTSKYAEYVMYDGKNPGSGITTIYRNTSKSKPVFLAGGININNVDEYLKMKPYAIDISTGVETDGIKDFNKMKEIIQRVRNYE